MKMNQKKRKEQEDHFIDRCIALCLERMNAENIDTESYTRIGVECVTAGVVIISMFSLQTHSQIAFHVHYEGNRYTGVPTYAMPINVNSQKETYTNTAKDAVSTLFSVCQ